MKRYKSVTIGCDPEFIIVDGVLGILITPEVLFGWGLNKFRGSPYRSAYGEDGCLFEIRPGYAVNTLHVVTKLRKTLKALADNAKGLKKYTWLTGHYPHNHALGGHIHIGGLNHNQNEIRPLISLLDYTIDSGISHWLDNQAQKQQRILYSHNQYGKRSLYRTFPSSFPITPERKFQRIEYRTPGSFLISPKVTFLFLVLAKICALVFLNDPNSSENILRPIKYMKRGKPLIEKFIRLVSDIDYIKSQGDIQIAFSLVESIPEHIRINWNKDFKKEWRI